MRTLRKTLCLTLVLTMLLGLVSVGASAAITVPDYSDADKIQYTEAVDVLSAIGVLQGDENGFRPTDTLTRAEACKIVVYLLGMSGVQGTAPFSDAASHWATSEIAYCAREGIVAGYGDGTFGPNDTLTGSQFAKMLLVALGYDAEAEGMVGQPWEIGVAKLIKQTKLDDGIKAFDQTANLTREEAAQLAFNTILTPIVTYDTKSTNIAVNGANISIGGSNWSYVVDSNSTARDTIYGNKEGHRIVNTNTNNTRVGNTVEFGEEYIKDLKLEGNDVVMDAYGRPSRTWLYKNEEIGEYIQKQWLLGTYTKKVASKDLYDLLGKTIYDSLKNGDCDLYGTLNGYQFADIVNGVATNNNIDRIINKANTFAVNDSGNGTVTEVYMDDSSDTVYVASWHTYVFQALGDYDSAREIVTLTPAGDTSEGKFELADRIIDVDDFPQIKDLKADDYVLVVGTAVNGDGRNGEVNDGRYDVQEVDKAELLTGKVDSYITDDPYKVTIAGTTYEYSRTARDSNEDNVKKTRYSLGNEATLVMDKYGYVIDVDAALAVGDYVFVKDFGKSASTIKGDALAEAYFADGTSGTINIRSAIKDPRNRDTDSTSNKTDIQSWLAAAHMGWYTFSRNSSNQYSLYKIENKYLPANATDTSARTKTNTILNNKPFVNEDTLIVENGKVRFLPNIDNAANLYANNKTVMLVLNETKDQDKEELTVYTGVDEIPDIKLLDNTGAIRVVVAAKDNGYVDFAFVDVTGNAEISGGKNINLVYVYKYNGVEYSTGNNAVYRYTLVDENGKEITRTADNKIDDGRYYAAYYVREDSDGVMTDFTKATQFVRYKDGVLWSDRNQTAMDYSSGTMTLGGQRYTFASDAKIFAITLKQNGEFNPGMDASILNRDKNSNYEFTRFNSAKALYDRLSPYSIVYDYAAKVDDTAGLMIKELYVTVRDARTKVDSYTSGDNDTTTGTLTISNSGTQLNTSFSSNDVSMTYLSALKNGNIGQVLYTGGWDVTDTYTVTAAKGKNPVIRVSGGNMTIKKGANLTLYENVIVNGDLIVEKDSQLLLNGGTLTVTGAVNIAGHVVQDGGNIVDTSGNPIDIDGDSLVINRGDARFSGTVTIKGRFFVARDSSASLASLDTLVVEKSADITLGGGSEGGIIINNLTVEDGAKVIMTGADVNIMGNLSIGAGASVSSTTGSHVTVFGNVTGTGSIDAGDGFEVGGNIDANIAAGGVTDLGTTNVSLLVSNSDLDVEVGEGAVSDVPTIQGVYSVYELSDDTLTLNVYNTSSDATLLTINVTDLDGNNVDINIVPDGDVVVPGATFWGDIFVAPGYKKVTISGIPTATTTYVKIS